MQDIADQQELAEEISTAISKPVGFGEEFDEVSVFMQVTQASQMTRAACGLLLQPLWQAVRGLEITSSHPSRDLHVQGMVLTLPVL